jgi:hypothetical protein
MSFQPIALQFDIATSAALAAVRAQLIATAKDANARVIATEPHPSQVLRYVDGVKDAPEEAVRQNGIIVYDYPRIDLVAAFARKTLRELSPVGVPPKDKHPGLYRDSHELFLNDSPVDDLKTWKSGDKVIIANFVDYARKIEVGAMKMRVPGTDHVYAQAEMIVQREYGELWKVKFTFVNFVNGALVKTRVSAETRFPALIFTE